MGHLTLLNGHGRDAPSMRHGGLLLLGVSLVLTSGCTSAILGTLLAPESVVAGAGSSLAEAGAQTLSGASLDELSNMTSTVQELDNILKEHPDAVNADQLKNLRDHLDQQAKSTDTGPDQRQVAREPPKPRRPTDTKLPVRKGDRLGVIPPGESVVQRRPAARPDTLPSGSGLRPDPTPVHAMSLRPVRLGK
jgi:hypothetical protein